MRKIAIILALVALGIGPVAAQTDESLDPEMGMRVSAIADKKLARGLHLRLEEEIRLRDNLTSFGRFHTTLGLAYKVNDYLKLGAGYALINPYDSDGGTFKGARHRLMLDATGSLRLGNWRLSLKERFQATYRSGDMNEYQNPRTALTLKSRLKLQYKGLRRLEPYAYVELRNTLNAPVISAYTDGTHYYTDATCTTQNGDPGWFISGWTGCYVNRVRWSMGAEYRLTRRSSVDVCLMADYIMERDVDANAEGTKLKSYVKSQGFVGWLTAGYAYSF